MTSRPQEIAAPGNSIAPLSIEELEKGLLSLGRHEVDLNAFWDENIIGFRQTVLFAICETSDALMSPTITPAWRVELENELGALLRYIKQADRYIAKRTTRTDFLEDR